MNSRHAGQPLRLTSALAYRKYLPISTVVLIRSKFEARNYTRHSLKNLCQVQRMLSLTCVRDKLPLRQQVWAPPQRWGPGLLTVGDQPRDQVDQKVDGAAMARVLHLADGLERTRDIDIDRYKQVGAAVGKDCRERISHLQPGEALVVMPDGSFFARFAPRQSAHPSPTPGWAAARRHYGGLAMPASAAENFAAELLPPLDLPVPQVQEPGPRAEEINLAEAISA
jgi:hypothetical protein